MLSLGPALGGSAKSLQPSTFFLGSVWWSCHLYLAPCLLPDFSPHIRLPMLGLQGCSVSCSCFSGVTGSSDLSVGSIPSSFFLFPFFISSPFF